MCSGMGRSAGHCKNGADRQEQCETCSILLIKPCWRCYRRRVSEHLAAAYSPLRNAAKMAERVQLGRRTQEFEVLVAGHDLCIVKVHDRNPEAIHDQCPSAKDKARSIYRRTLSKGQVAVPWALPPAPTSTPDTLRTLRFRAWAALVCRASSGRFWHGFAVRLAACMDAGRRCISRLFWTTDAEEMPDASDNNFERLLSPEEVARACGLSRRAVYRAIARGELRAARLCHRLRVQPAELERWIGEQTLTPAPPASRRVTRSMRSVRRGSLRAMLDGVEEREAHGER